MTEKLNKQAKTDLGEDYSVTAYGCWYHLNELNNLIYRTTDSLGMTIYILLLSDRLGK